MKSNWKSCLFAMTALVAVAYAQSSGTLMVNNMTVNGTCTGCGSGAPVGSTYLVVGSADATLTNERVATAGTGISITDGGAGGNATIAADTAVMLSRATDQAGTSRYCRSTTGNDTYTCTLTPTLTAYTRGMCLAIDADTANTGTATVNVDTLGGKSLLTRSGGALADGDIPANKPVVICYDGTQFVLQGGQSSSTSTTLEMRFGECDTNGVGVQKMWSIPSTGGATIVCSGASPNTYGAGSFTNGSSTSLERNFWIPASWSGGAVTANLVYGEAANSGSGNLKWDVSIVCMGNGAAFGNPTYPTATSTGSVAVASGSGTNDSTKYSQISITPTGCSAGNYARARLTRDHTVPGNYGNPMQMLMFSLVF